MIHRVPERPEDTERVRLSDYLVGVFPELPSRKSVKKAIKKGWVSVDGESGTSGLYIMGGELIELDIPPPPATGKSLDLGLVVQYQDDYLAVVEKPAGLLTSGNKWRTLANALPAALDTPAVDGQGYRPRPAHRLDFATSGLVLVGKLATSLVKIHEMFREGRVEKTYYAVTAGATPQEGFIDAAIAGKPSRTHYQLMATIPSPRFGHLCLLRLRPLTGRRHQLRIHLANMNAPILGDRLYGNEAVGRAGKGMYLHAAELSFVHPVSGDMIRVQSPLPKKFTRLFS